MKAIHGVIKSLKKSNHDLYIIGCDVQKYNYAYDLADEFYVSPSYRDEKTWNGFVLEILKNNIAEYFWPVTEPEIKIVNSNKVLYESYKVVMNKTNVLEVAMDKGRTTESLLKAGIKTPQTWTDISSCEENYPLIVKEKFGCGSHSVSIVNNHNKLIEEFNRMSDPVIQTYIGDAGNEYTMTVFSDGHVVNSIAFKRSLGFRLQLGFNDAAWWIDMFEGKK